MAYDRDEISFLDRYTPSPHSSDLTGIITVKVVPLPEVLLTAIVPPCASAGRLEMARPNLIPLGLAAIKSDQIFSDFF